MKKQEIINSFNEKMTIENLNVEKVTEKAIGNNSNLYARFFLFHK